MLNRNSNFTHLSEVGYQSASYLFADKSLLWVVMSDSKNLVETVLEELKIEKESAINLPKLKKNIHKI